MKSQEILLGVLAQRLELCNNGLLITDIHEVDIGVLCSALVQKVNRKLFIAIVGKNTQPQANDSIEYAFTIEKAVEWRSEPEKAGGVLVFVYGETSKLHSLAEYDMITTRDMAEFLIATKIESESKATNQQIQGFWQAIKSTITDYRYEMLLDFVASIPEDEGQIDALPRNMWRLGLLCDFSILGKMSNNDRLIRLSKNNEMRIEICQLNSESRTRLNRTLQNFAHSEERAKLDAAYKSIKSYLKYGKIADLMKLDYETVERLLSASKPVKLKKEKNKSEPRAVEETPKNILKGKELDKLINDCLVNGSKEDKNALSDVAELLNAQVEAGKSESDEGGTINTIGGRFEGRELQIEPGTNELIRLFGRACNAEAWGGVIQTKERTIKDALLETDNDFFSFCPEKTDSIVFQFDNRSLFDCIVAFDEKLNSEEKFKPILDAIITSRKQLAAKLELIAYHPSIAFGACKELRIALKCYLEGWQQLLKLYCDKQSDMLKISPDATHGIARALVCLDALYISMEAGEWKAVILPLHPLFLWRFYEIFEKLFQSAGGVDEISAEDKECLTNALSELPNLVNFIIIDKILTDGQDIPLQYSGSYEMLPTFENKTNRYAGVDGIEQIGELLQRWVAFAPYTKYEIRLAIIDAPDLIDVIKAVKIFLLENNCDKLVLDAYYTRNQNATGELTHLEYEARDNDVGELIQGGRLALHVFQKDLLGVENALKKRPVHIAYFFDQATYSIQYGANTQYHYISPLVITYDYEYDEMTNQGRIYPTSDSEDDLIGRYHKIMRFADLVKLNSVPRPTLNSKADLSPVNRTIRNNSAIWLAIADRITTNYVPEMAIPIGEKYLGRRHLSIWANEDSRIISQYESILRNYNLLPNSERLRAVLKQFGHIASEGLISMPKSGDSGALDARKKGLLGTIFSAAWYKHRHENALIASLDSHEARQWLYDKSSASNERADLIGLWYDDAKCELNIDVLEVKTREGAADEEYAIEQIERMLAMLQSIFNQTGANTDLFTVSRREVLKYQIITECFRSIHEPVWQKKWSDIFKEAFSEHEKGFTIKISGVIIHIKLNSVEVEAPPKTAKEGINKVVLSSTAIQRYIFNNEDILLREEQVIDFDDTKISGEEYSVQDGLIRDNGIVLAVEEDAAIERIAEAEIAQQAISEAQNATIPDGEAFEREILELSRAFRKACEAYNIKIKECDEGKAIVGSGVIRFYVLLERGQGLEALRNRLEDIGREMKRSNLIVQTVLNSNEIVLDVPRLKKDSVLYSSIVDKLPNIASPEQLFFPIGKTPEGEDIIENLSELPHILVGGSTGSGKTVFLFTLLASLIHSHPTKKELQLVLSSAGIEDFIHFEGLPHLINGKIIDSAKETVEIIQTVVNEEFERRAGILSAARVSNIIEYNKKVEKNDRIAPIVIVIDEFADIADQFSKKAEREEFYSVVRRIVQIGRKRGIHMVLCTQRPSANLVPTDIKAQLNARIALRVNDANSSRMILEITGAQNLQKHGDLIYKDGEKLIRAQGYYITIDELNTILEKAK